MKQLARLLIVSAFFSFAFNAFGHSSNYPFDVKISGKGDQSIIFIPGFACSGEVWNETVEFYEKDFTCYILTMPGFAGIPPHPGSTFQSWKESIASFIRQNNIEKPIVTGHSMGGGLAMALAADYPELISKIIVVDALPCLAALMDPSFQAGNNNCSEMVSQITSAPDSAFYQMQKYAISTLLADTAKQELVVNWSMTSDRTTFAEMYCSFLNIDLREKISSIECPSLVLLQPYFSNFQNAINDQYKNLKTANFQYASRGLHFIMFDDKNWYIEQMNSFIKE